MTVAAGQEAAADPTTAAGAAVADAGQNPGAAADTTQAGTQQQQQQAGAAETTPLFVANSQEELDAKFGQTRQEGSLRVAKQHGFDTVEEFNTAVASWKQAHEAGLTDQQKAEQRQRDLERTNTQLLTQVASQKMAQTQQALADKLGIDKAKLDRVERYREKTEGEIDATGNVNEALVENSMIVFLTQNPEFKAPPVTVGSGGSPAGAAADVTSLDARIEAAQNEGKVQEAISLQLQKLFQPVG